MKPRRAPRLLADVQRELQALHASLMMPMARQLDDAERLVIVPHGPLHALPFCALHDGQRHLVETHELEIAPSASLHVHLARRIDGSRAADGDVLVVGVPDEIATGITQEAELVARTLAPRPVRHLIGPEANSHAFTEHAGRCSVLHLACHGRFEHQHPRASGLRLADRWFNLQDICALRLRADLVTLSACETGLSRVAAGDELTGLFRALLAAGARSVLGSLWRVDDDSAAAFMPAFYDSWTRGPRAAGSAALREAQLALMAKRPHAAFWAPFVLTGGAS
jgi:CHAT domain-containing protein